MLKFCTVRFYMHGKFNIIFSKSFCTFIGWATAELVMTKLLPLWVGARGIEFDWKYMQMSFDANVALVSVHYKKYIKGIHGMHNASFALGTWKRVVKTKPVYY